MAGGAQTAVCPHPQPLAGGGQQGRAQRAAVPVAAVPGVDDQLRGRRLHRVGVLQLGVADEFVADAEQQMGDTLAGAARPSPATTLNWGLTRPLPYCIHSRTPIASPRGG